MKKIQPIYKERNSIDLKKLIRECQESGVIKLPEVASALEFLLENPNDTQLLEIVQEALSSYSSQQMINPDPFQATNPVDYRITSGSIKLGFIEHSNIKYGINPDELTTHLLIAGRTGGGKTSLVLLILSQILELRNNVNHL
jgi:ABC-type multidrug transport system fused ATPase/permease subunit